jgi:hypothetical protein
MLMGASTGIPAKTVSVETEVVLVVVVTSILVSVALVELFSTCLHPANSSEINKKQEITMYCRFLDLFIAQQLLQRCPFVIYTVVC